MSSLRPNPLMLLRIAQADAYGAAAEYLKLPRDQKVHDAAMRFERYVAHPTHDHRAGTYTDDTQMSIAVAEVMIEGVKEIWAPARRQFADAFVRVFRRDPRKGYARGFQAFLESEAAATGPAFLHHIRPTSDKNGAAMRAVPIGVLPDLTSVVWASLVNASLTHDTPGGQMSSLVTALLSHFALYTDEPFNSFVDWVADNNVRMNVDDLETLRRMVAVPWTDPVQSKRGHYSVAYATTHAVIHLLTRTSGLRESLLQAIQWGGDVDSVAAIAWGIQSSRPHEPLPDWLTTNLERDPYGRRYLEDLGQRLMSTYA